ncbi:MAG: choline/carnitine O-acyltransferase [candidate division KSB1 bacterium]|nr:choline/carnitine O-acyltransferase [candidate division KSB1 bacterium]MDZ7335932.1 choline/carnitine O-acyltransferase [candidate division KSB1 bacterium]MDZ7356793.1 choline/carnitine O-acyltransferase [candidate division KSB1 bacterium]MDZ7375892.1 choline/carnitine O-acyltransferase [candidate division KSB1 bacterium]MDZ7401248.1 choline/carnitine O-acyltransferase [candidate division KSB1 bacterium]
METILSHLERSSDIYELIPGYPKPPLIPLPELGDMSSLARVGLKSSALAHSLSRLGLRISGFLKFQKTLPERLELLLRRCDLRGGYLFAPVVSATLALEDDARQLPPLDRATTLLIAAGQLYQDIVSARLEPDRYRGNTLEMGQYPNLFSTCLIIDGKRPRILKSANHSHIVVLIHGQQHALELGDPTSWRPASIKRALEEIVERAAPSQSTEPPGILTGADHPTQMRIFRQLQRIELNRRSLKLLQHSFLILCLDLDDKPSSYAEAARIGHGGNFANRWYHASLQIIVFGNARACITCNFSTYVDGNTMMRAASEIKRRAARVEINDGWSEGNAPSAKKLYWSIAPRFIQQAQYDLNRIVDHQPATFEIAGCGRSYFSARGLDGVPIFMVALQLTTKKFTGKMVEMRQFLTLSRYRCMGLTDAVVTTPEVIQLVTYLDQATFDPKRAGQLLEAAIASQVSACRQARSHLSLDSLIGLYLVSSSTWKRRYIQFVLILVMALLRLFGLFRPAFQREVIVSHPEIYPEVPVVGRPGIRLPYVKYFGLHYQMMADRIIMTMMPSVKWSIPNADFIAELKKNLQLMQQIIEGRSE